MNNEDKAKQLCREFENAEICGSPLSRGSVAFQSSMKMAEWKDQKFDAILLCVKNSFEKQNIKGADEFIAEMKKHWEM